MSTRALKLARDVATHPVSGKRPLRSILSALAWQLFKRLTPSPQQRLFWGMRFNCYADSHIAGLLIYYAGFPEYRSMTFLKRFLRPGDAVLDIGANIGSYSLFMASIVGQQGRIDAFEPSPVPHSRLCENIALNKEVCINAHRFAIGETEKTANLITSSDGAAGFVSSKKTHDSVDVQQRKLGDVISSNTGYTFAKVDTEGAELEVLKGAQEFLRAQNPPVWQLELDGLCQRFGVQSSDIVDWLLQHGYKSAIYRPDENALQLTQQPWHYMDAEKNILAISAKGEQLIHERMPDVRWR